MKKEEFRNKFISYMDEIEEYLSKYRYTKYDEFHLCVILGNIETCFKQCLIKEGIKNYNDFSIGLTSKVNYNIDTGKETKDGIIQVEFYYKEKLIRTLDELMDLLFPDVSSIEIKVNLKEDL